MESESDCRATGSKTRKSEQKKNKVQAIIIEQCDAGVDSWTDQESNTSLVNRPSRTVGDSAALSAIAEANDVSETSSSEELKLGFFSILRLALKRRLTSFAQEASIAYMSYLVKKASSTYGSVARKTLWTVLLLFGVGFMTFQFHDRISYYLSYPTVADYQIIYDRSLRFPAVTICPEIILSRRRVVQLFGAKAAEMAAQLFPPYPDIDLRPDYKSLNSSHWNVDWRKIFKSATPTVDEFLVHCEFQKKPCDLRRDLTENLYELRKCFTFNSKKSNSYLTQGADNGLRLVLWMNQSDALVILAQAAGFRVLLHDPSEVPAVQSLGFRASPGKTTVVSFTFRNISQLPAPYGDCYDEKGYTLMECCLKCGYNYIWTNCNCSFDASDDRPVCNPEQIGDCVKSTVQSFISTGASRSCDCPMQCNQRNYPYIVSSSPMSQYYLNSSSTRLDFRRRNIDTSRLNRELVILDLFYSKLTYVDIQTKPAYNALKLFADLGGALGLILGGTVLTVYELFEFIFDLLYDFVASYKFFRRMRTSRPPI